MSLFSPEIMATFTSEEQPLARRQYGERETKGTPTQVFRSKLTVAQWFDRAKAMQADTFPAGRKFARHSEGHSNSDWSGMSGQTMDDAYRTGIITNAVKAFENAAGSLETAFARAAPILSPVGGAFSVGRIISGHPKAAIIRPKAKLPPKKIELILNVSCVVSEAAIAQSMAKIAKAAWEYMSAGGVVELSVSFLHNFSQPQEWEGKSHHALIDTIKINPVSAAAFASAASGQMYRAFSMPIGQAMSGDSHDGLPIGAWANPSAFPIQGEPTNDAKALEALRIK